MNFNKINGFSVMIAKSNLRSRMTARKYEWLGNLPSELKQPRSYRTWIDPFEAE